MIDTTGNGEGGKRFTPKTFNPGNYVAVIDEVTLSLREYNGKTNWDITLTLVGPDLPDFEGFHIDPKDPARGRYKGQIGRVRMDRWGYSDYTFPDGNVKKAADMLLSSLQILCRELGIEQWLKDQHNKYTAIGDLFKAFQAEKPFKKIPMHWCLGAREYLNKNKYTAYDLFLPRFSTSGKPFSKVESEIVKYFAPNHLIKYQPKPGETAAQPQNTQQTVQTQTAATFGNPNVVTTNTATGKSVPADDFLAQIEALAKSDKAQVKGGAMQPNSDFLNNQSQMQSESAGLTAKDIITDANSLPFSLD